IPRAFAWPARLSPSHGESMSPRPTTTASALSAWTAHVPAPTSDSRTAAHPAPTPRALPKSLRLELGRRAADSPMVRQDKVWSRFSNDKADIAEELLNVLSDLYRALPPRTPLRGLSLGCSSEPQFRILEPACQGGL